jgi:hypothetical protein
MMTDVAVKQTTRTLSGAAAMGAGPGRPKGSINKAGKAAKDAIAAAAEQLGGEDRMVAWALENERNEAAFWTIIYPKLLPLQVYGKIDHKHALRWLPSQ